MATAPTIPLYARYALRSSPPLPEAPAPQPVPATALQTPRLVAGFRLTAAETPQATVPADNIPATPRPLEPVTLRYLPHG